MSSGQTQCAQKYVCVQTFFKRYWRRKKKGKRDERVWENECKVNEWWHRVFIFTDRRMPMALYSRVHSNEQFMHLIRMVVTTKIIILLIIAHRLLYRPIFLCNRLWWPYHSTFLCVCAVFIRCLLAIVSRISLYNSLKCQLKNCDLNVDVTLFFSSCFLLLNVKTAVYVFESMYTHNNWQKEYKKSFALIKEADNATRIARHGTGYLIWGCILHQKKRK